MIDGKLSCLSVGLCVDVLRRSGGLGLKVGLKRAEAAAERMIVERFEEVTGTEGFMELEEAAIWRVLEDERLEDERPRGEERGAGV